MARARFRRWAPLLGLSVDQLVAWGVLYYAYSVLSVPIADDLGVSTRFVAGAFSCTLLVSGLLARPVGRVLDRAGARTVMLPGALVGAAVLVTLAVTRQPLPLVMLFAALGISHASSLYEAAFRAVVDWHPTEPNRARALLVLTSIAGLASATFLPLTASLVQRCGWRATVVILAVVLLAVTIPARLALPVRSRISARDEGVRDTPPLAASVLAAGFALQTFASTGAIVSMVWALHERGQTVATAAMMAGLVGASQVPGRLLWAPLCRVMLTQRRLPVLFVVQAVALAAIAMASGPALVVAVVLFGAAGGLMTLERATVVAEWFGLGSFGARSGHIASVAAFARAASPFAVELMHGVVSYAGVFELMAIILLLGSAAVGVATRIHQAALRSSVRGPGTNPRAPRRR